MPADIIAFHVGLAVLLFFIMNWIGGYAATSSSYYQISYFDRHEEAPAFNIVFRVLAPSVYLIIVAATLYAVGLNYFVTGLYLVVLYQALLRWLFNLAWGRRLLVRWGRQVVIATASLLLAFVCYRQILTDPARVLPDFSTIANELWIAVALFLYATLNKVQVPDGANERKKRRYIEARYRKFRQRYGTVIKEHIRNHSLEPLVYSVLIYESFNRPAFVQFIERWVLFPIGLSRSLGPMQVRVSERVSDEQSVVLGVQGLANLYRRSLKRAKEEYGVHLSGDWQPSDAYVLRRAMEMALGAYNVRSDYPAEVLAIHHILAESHYKEREGVARG